MTKPTPFKIISDIVSKTDHPWEYEPDLYEWTHRGIECVARRNMTHGAWCGYVDVPREVWDKLDSDLPRAEWVENELNVHGGVTYSENNLDKDAKRIGFDCSHGEDYLPKITDLTREIMYHKDEKPTYRTLSFVIVECESMVDQILAVTGGDVGDKP